MSTAPKERAPDPSKMSKNKKKKMKKKMKKQQALLEMQMQQIEEVATQVPIDTADSCDFLVAIETVHASCHMLRFRGGESLWKFIQHRKLVDYA